MAVETTKNSAEPQPTQPVVERPADSPNAEPHPVEDLRQTPTPSVDELLAKKPVSPTAGGKTSAGKPPRFGVVTSEVGEAEVTEPAGSQKTDVVDELLEVDEAKTLSFTDAATLAAKLADLRKQAI